MRIFLTAFVAVFLCAGPVSAQSCRTPEAQITIWGASLGPISVAEWTGNAAEKITAAYNAIEPASEHRADRVLIVTSKNTPGQGAILFSLDGCLVAVEAGRMHDFEFLIIKALGVKS